MKLVKPLQDRQSLPTRGLKGSPAIWMEEKKERDSKLWGCQTSNYWILENKLYDLTTFVDKHPGGKSWITMTKGQDITDHFIVHHIDEPKARKLLDKYYVGETKNKVARYSYAEDGLYRTIKKRVLERMSLDEIRSETKSKIFAIIILSFLLGSLAITSTYLDVQNPFMSYVWAAITSFFLIGMIGIGHNFVHHKQGFFKYFYVITGFTHNQWQIMHCISHHIYPNTQLDYQSASLQPIAYFLRTSPENHLYTEPLLIFAMIFIQPLNLLLKLIVVPIIRKKLPQFWYVVPLSIFSIFYFISGDFYYSLKLHVFLYGIFGIAFNRVLFCGHRVQQVWSEGAERIDDFGQHTIYSTADTDVRLTGFFSYLLVGGFNIHTPHHLFPTADLSALPKILAIIDEVCKERSIRQTKNSRLSCFVSLSKNIIKRTPFSKK